MKISDAEARLWGCIELLVVVATIFIFVYAARLPGAQAGTIFAIVTYFWDYQGSLDRLPVLIQSISRVKDILHRIDAGMS